MCSLAGALMFRVVLVAAAAAAAATVAAAIAALLPLDFPLATLPQLLPPLRACPVLLLRRLRSHLGARFLRFASTALHPSALRGLLLFPEPVKLKSEGGGWKMMLFTNML
jgi:hypothetical protein